MNNTEPEPQSTVTGRRRRCANYHWCRPSMLVATDSSCSVVCDSQAGDPLAAAGSCRRPITTAHWHCTSHRRQPEMRQHCPVVGSAARAMLTEIWLTFQQTSRWLFDGFRGGGYAAFCAIFARAVGKAPTSDEAPLCTPTPVTKDGLAVASEAFETSTYLPCTRSYMQCV
jgi:hypothetical protein